MTAEQRPGYKLLKIDWPAEVTLDDLAEIHRFRGEGRSLAASVAQTILDESKQPSFDLAVEGSDQADIKIFGALGRFQAHSLSRLYGAAARLILDAEAAIRGGESIVEELIAEFDGKQVSYTDVQGAKPDQPVREAYMEVRRQQYATILTQNGPLALVDFYVDSRIESIKGRPSNIILPKKKEAAIVALDKGRQRFHQLYDAAQS